MSKQLRIKLFIACLGGSLLLLLALSLSYSNGAHSSVLPKSEINSSELEAERLAISKLYDSGKLDEAITRSLKALEMSPGNPRLQALLAANFLQRGSAQFDEKNSAIKAKELSYEIISKNPRSSLGYHLLAYAFEIEENYPEAIHNYNLAIAIDSSAAYLYSARGHAFDLDGQIDNAISDHKKAIKLDPSDVVGLLNLARIELRRQNLELANQFASEAVKNAENVFFKAEALLVQGYVALQQNKKAEALEFMLSAEELTPKSPSVLLGVAQTRFAELENVTSGQELADKANQVLLLSQNATKINPNHSLAFLVAARTLRLVKNPAADKLYEMAERACPNDITLGRLEKDKLCPGIQAEKNSILGS